MRQVHVAAAPPSLSAQPTAQPLAPTPVIMAFLGAAAIAAATWRMLRKAVRHTTSTSTATTTTTTTRATRRGLNEKQIDFVPCWYLSITISCGGVMKK